MIYAGVLTKDPVEVFDIHRDELEMMGREELEILQALGSQDFYPFDIQTWQIRDSGSVEFRVQIKYPVPDITSLEG